MANDISKNSFNILVNGVVFDGERVLISQRSWEEEHMPGRWTIPGGKVDHSKEDVINVRELADFYATEDAKKHCIDFDAIKDKGKYEELYKKHYRNILKFKSEN